LHCSRLAFFFSFSDSGDLSAIRTPDSWPYIPAQDICGEVVDVDPHWAGHEVFVVGDIVVATWGGMMAMGGLAEYCLVQADLATHKPAQLTAVEGAALSNSPCHARIAVDEAKLKITDRVLILNGTGGCGSALVQLVRDVGVSLIAATGTDTAFLSSLGVDRPIDYTTENWWELAEFQTAANKFDVIFDLAEGAVGWQRCGSVLKTSWEGGRYYAFLLNEWDIVAKSKLFMVTFAAQVAYRTLTAAVMSSVNAAPAYTMKLSSPDAGLLSRVCELASTGRLKSVLAGGAAYPFTTTGAVEAFDLLKSRRTKGKIVIKVAD